MPNWWSSSRRAECKSSYNYSTHPLRFEFNYGCEPSQLPTVLREILKKQDHIKFMTTWAIEMLVSCNAHEERRNSYTGKLISDFHKLVEDRDFSVMPP